MGARDGHPRAFDDARQSLLVFLKPLFELVQGEMRSYAREHLLVLERFGDVIDGAELESLELIHCVGECGHEAQDSSGERKAEDLVRLTAPEEARDRDVGIEDGPHARARRDFARGPLLPCRRSPASRPR